MNKIIGLIAGESTKEDIGELVKEALQMAMGNAVSNTIEEVEPVEVVEIAVDFIGFKNSIATGIIEHTKTCETCASYVERTKATEELKEASAKAVEAIEVFLAANKKFNEETLKARGVN